MPFTTDVVHIHEAWFQVKFEKRLTQAAVRLFKIYLVTLTPRRHMNHKSWKLKTLYCTLSFFFRLKDYIKCFWCVLCNTYTLGCMNFLMQSTTCSLPGYFKVFRILFTESSEQHVCALALKCCCRKCVPKIESTDHSWISFISYVLHISSVPVSVSWKKTTSNQSQTAY